MERILNDHEARLRIVERTLLEQGYSIDANGKLLHILIPKVDALVEDDRLAAKLATALKSNEKGRWTRRERYMGIFIGVATIGNILLNTIFLFSHN